MRFIEKLNKYHCGRFMSFRSVAVQALNATCSDTKTFVYNTQTHARL